METVSHLFIAAHSCQAVDPEAVAGVGPPLLLRLVVLPAPPHPARAVVVIVVVGSGKAGGVGGPVLLFYIRLLY